MRILLNPLYIVLNNLLFQPILFVELICFTNRFAQKLSNSGLLITIAVTIYDLLLLLLLLSLLCILLLLPFVFTNQSFIIIISHPYTHTHTRTHLSLFSILSKTWCPNLNIIEFTCVRILIYLNAFCMPVIRHEMCNLTMSAKELDKQICIRSYPNLLLETQYCKLL